MKRGLLYLIPCSLGEQTDTAAMLAWQPAAVRQQIHALQHFVVENAKTARAFLKACAHPLPIAQLQIQELSKHSCFSAAASLTLLRDGTDIGILSEAGCPGIADPGAELVAAAHAVQLEVKPLVGPSSLLLALMASGMNGQSFAFHGYLPIPAGERAAKLKSLEACSRQTGQTQFFIETPFRNQALFNSLLNTLSETCKLGIACDLTGAQEWIAVQTISRWKKASAPDLQKRPAVFLLDAR